MPPPQKTAKHAAKKTAKKAAKKSAAQHATNDIRRIYEHLGRLEALQDGLPDRVVTQVRRLTDIAQQAMHGSDARSAADLLRAAEHLSFAALATQEAETIINEALLSALTSEFDHLRQRAQEHWSGDNSTLTALYDEARASADKARSKRNYRRALEFIRAADAFAHVGFAGGLVLAAGKSRSRLTA